MPQLTHCPATVVEGDGVGGVVDDALSESTVLTAARPAIAQRTFCNRLGNIGLHWTDGRPYGPNLGGGDEIWFWSRGGADNPPEDKPPWDEGQTFIAGPGGRACSFDHALGERRGVLVGDDADWEGYAKFFDNDGPICHHMHDNDTFARQGDPKKKGKRESYFIPPEINTGPFRQSPEMYVGLLPTPPEKRDELRAKVKKCLENWGKCEFDLRMLSLAVHVYPEFAYHMLEAVLHAPSGGITFFEIMNNSDVFRMYNGNQNDIVTPQSLLWAGVPEDKVGDLEYVLDALDWDANCNPYLVPDGLITPLPVKGMHGSGVEALWRVWGGSNEYWMRTVRLEPGKSVKSEDDAASGIVTIAGHGKIDKIETGWPGVIRVGKSYSFEHFVPRKATPTITAGPNGLSMIQFFCGRPPHGVDVAA